VAALAHDAAELGGLELRAAATSLGYVLVAFVGRWLLDERITRQRWAGIC